MCIFNQIYEAEFAASSLAHHQEGTKFSPSPGSLQPSGAERRSSSWKQTFSSGSGSLLFYKGRVVHSIPKAFSAVIVDPTLISAPHHTANTVKNKKSLNL